KNSFALRTVLLARERLGLPVSDQDTSFKAAFLRDFADYPNLCAAFHMEQARRLLNQENFRACRESLLLAHETLKKTGAQNQLQATLSYLSGDLARLEQRTEDAKRHFNKALSIYEKLGNKSASEFLQRFLPLINRQTPQDNDVLSVRLSLSGRSFVVEASKNGLTGSETKIFSTPIELKGITAETRDRSAIYNFSKALIARPFKTEETLGELLFAGTLAEPRLNERRTKKPPDFNLDSLSPSNAKVPWELARIRRKTVALLCRYFYRSSTHTSGNRESAIWLQLALSYLVNTDTVVDGILGPKTQLGLQALKKKFKLPADLLGARLNTEIGELLVGGKSKRRTKAFVLLPESNSQLRLQRRAEYFAPRIDWLYKDCYFDVQSHSRIERLQSIITSFPPDVIHIQSSFKEIPTTGQIYLDFGYGEQRYSWESMASSDEYTSLQQTSPSLLNDMLARLPDSQLRPLIILD
ncbi:MAG: hypothetical protein ACRD8U_04390, partial [Pyrinomonadaceae bacterium]